MWFSSQTSVLVLLAGGTLQAHAGLLPKIKPKGHLQHARRGSPLWTSKRDSTLLSPAPPPAAIAQAQQENSQLARNAYANLARLSGNHPATSDDDDDSSDDTDNSTVDSLLRRAAMPQRAPKPSTVPVPVAMAKKVGKPKSKSKPLPAVKPTHSKAARSLPGLGNNFQYGVTPIRGVNIGGWLVLEPWITPSIFAATNDSSVVDEYTFGSKYGPIEASRLLTPHWDTWITEQDFIDMASNGLNHVRIPIGYWALDGKEGKYAQGQYPYLFKAVGWAKTHGLKVIIDLHGAPGSQNGFDNSGRRGSADWPNDPDNVSRTRAVLQTMIDDFYVPEFYDTVTSFELLNEPAGFLGGNMMDTVKQYYYDAYGQVRYPAWPDGNTTASDLLVTIHDAFQPLPSWEGFMPSPKWSNVALDTHYYSVFNENDLRMTDDERIQAVCSAQAGLVESNKNLWTMVGEWSPAPTDCAAALNGRGIGSRYDGSYPGSTAIGSCEGKSGDASNFSEDYKTFLGKYWEVQATVFEKASGHIMWAWKTENAHEWSYQKGVEYGWIPEDPSQRRYPNPCSS